MPRFPRSTRTLPLLFAALCLAASLSYRAVNSESATNTADFVGSEQCVACHANIANVQLKSDHALTLRHLKDVPEFLKTLPLSYQDQANLVEYRLQSWGDSAVLEASRKGQRDEIELLWAFGAGRKALTFVGKTKAGIYGQVRVSWYSATNDLDITPGSKATVKDATDALADWFEPGKREECFGCHVSRQAHLLPEHISPGSAGIQCERCHGPGRQHIKALTEGKGKQDLAIRHPGRLGDREQYQLCGDCHRQPPADFDSEAIDKIIKDPVSIRFPARRLVLSRCYNEGTGELKCTLCHNPHGQLAAPAEYDQKCLSCHALAIAERSHCPVSRKDCISCHMPRQHLAKHLEFADHWIRVVR